VREITIWKQDNDGLTGKEMASKHGNELKQTEVACSNMKTIGCQHINRHKIIDTDASDSSITDIFSSTSKDILVEEEWQEPEQKRQKIHTFKTCQLKIFMDCNNLLLPHNANFTQLTGTKTKLEVLILCPQNSKSICRKIATHLGLIFIEDMLEKIKKNTKNKILFDNVDQKEGKLYPLFQNYVARSLMLGCSNISLTCNLAIFKHMKSNVKCMIFIAEDEIINLIAQPLINMFVQIKNDTFGDYLCAISEIIDFTLKFKVSIPAIYSISDKLYNCNVSAVGIVPLYVLKFFAAKKMAEENVIKSLF